MESRIGPYIVEREIGRGGMGVVYLAHDERLNRRVAIKALPDDLAKDPVRLERFEREGRALAQLNHPNIAGIYGVEEQNGTRYLILEFVEGQTLGDRLDAGPIPVDEALELAEGIAGGLEAAHDVGVVHRDLKPDNIKVAPDGTVKVLDFGLAKAADSGTGAIPTDSPTVISPRSPTIPGAILGTAAYMSPEQARGRHVDRRTDIWSFGVILYEMLTGIGPFAGETPNDAIGAVLHKEIDLRRLPPGVSPGVTRALQRCLARDKSQRYRDIADVRIELRRADDEPQIASHGGLSQHRLVLAVLVALLIVGAVGWFLALNRPARDRLEVRKFDLMQGSIAEPVEVEQPRISPDGTRVAFIRDEFVWVRDLSSFEPRQLAGTAGATSVFWSPDSKWIGYGTSDAIYKLALSGGNPVKLADALSYSNWDRGGGWTKDDRIIYREDECLAEVAVRGGEPRSFLSIEDLPEAGHFHPPTVIPGTNVVLFTQHQRNGEYLLVALDGDRRVVLTTGIDQPVESPAFSSTGHVLFVRGYGPQTVWAVGFDPVRMEVQSEPFLVMPDAGNPSVAEDGTLLVFRGAVQLSGQLVMVGPDDEARSIGDPLDILISPMISPDEGKIAFSTGRAGKFDVWVHDLIRGSRTRITFTESLTFPVAWSADSTVLAVIEVRPNRDETPITRFYAADGSGETRQSISTAVMSFDEAWSVAVGTDDPMAQKQTYLAVHLDDPSHKSVVLDSSGHIQGLVKLNPSGTLLAYESRESGTAQVYCTRFPEGPGKWQVSVDGGTNPTWSADGRTLYFESEDREVIYALDVEIEPSIRFGLPQKILDAKRLGLNLETGWSVTADGTRFVTLRSDPATRARSSISVVENWYEEFRNP
ncbi:MAG: serine/threonine-protein kinase [Phycisphaeraceae bacterium]|nr:serine/threonine-protein kinase [Phycisphaeraceae bacterium]